MKHGENTDGPRSGVRALLLLSLGLACAVSAADNVVSLEPLGWLIRECSLPGERRADDVVPRHANCIQVSRSRWLVVYSTHGFRGVDDERSIVWQLRRDAPDGPVLTENFFVRALNNWQPEGLPPAPAGTNYFKQHGHMVAFGVPKGAVLGGRPAPQANLFVAQWRVLGRPLELKRDYLHKSHPGTPLFDRTQGVEWVQFRLNDREDDLEVLQPVRRLRQQGFEAGAKFCQLDGAAWMNQSFCPPVPTQADGAEWAVANHFDGGRVAALRFRFNATTRRYEWGETGPMLLVPKRALSEASLVRLPTGWLLASRAGGVAWTRAADPFTRWEDTTFASEPVVSAPLIAALCGDGVVRLLTGDKMASAQRYDRDPLYCWDVELGASVGVTHRRTVFDSVAAKLPIRPGVRSKVDFGEFFPHHGRTQLIVHGVSTRAYNHAYEGNVGIPALNAEEKAASGIYHSRMTFTQEPPPLWRFAP